MGLQRHPALPHDELNRGPEGQVVENRVTGGPRFAAQGVEPDVIEIEELVVRSRRALGERAERLRLAERLQQRVG